MTALDRALSAARADNRAALIGYLPAGIPSGDGVSAAEPAVRAMVDGGCDVLEVGLPYSDPVLDGPTIQEAVDRALRAGVRIADVLATVSAVADAGAAALVMTYWNPVERYGERRFAERLAEAGGAGVILPDLPVEDAQGWLSAAAECDLSTVFVVAPSTTDERLARICAACTGFVYAASLMGVTGAREDVSGAAASLVARLRRVTGLPVCVGLGVSTGAQAAEIAGFADGVIVGSAFVRRVLDAATPAAAAQAVRALAADLSGGVRAGRRAAG